MKISIMSLAAAALIMVACQQQNEKVKTKSGLDVQFAKKNNGRTKQHGEILFFNMRYTTDTDSVMLDTKEKGPISIPYDSAQWKTAGIIYEAFDLLSEGDSITFSMSAEELFVNTFRTEIPAEIKKESNVKFYLGLDKILNEDEFRAEQKAEYGAQFEEQYLSRLESIKLTAADQLKIDGEIIDKYLAQNNIVGQKTASGLRYIITQEGSGPNAAAGDMIEAHYDGALLDGTKFDSSYDRGTTFEFTLREGRVILGWDEGFGLLNTGAKATLYIPSSLGYGERAQGATIKENSILKFDVELVSIK